MSNLEVKFSTSTFDVDNDLVADEMNKVDGITAYASYGGVSVDTDDHSAAFVEDLFNNAVSTVMGICDGGTARMTRIYVDFDVRASVSDVKKVVAFLDENDCRADYEYGLLRVRSEKLTQQDIVSLVGEKLDIIQWIKVPKVSVSFDAHDVDFPIHKLVKQVNRVEGVKCRFSAFSGEIILSSKEYDSYDLESIYNKYVSELEEQKPEKRELPYLYIDKISVVYGIYDMGTENSGYIVRACEDISEKDGFSAKPLIGDKIVVEVNDTRGIEDIMKEVEKRFQLYG